jgi:ribosomal protein S27AE
VAFRIPADPGDPGLPEVRLGRAAGADSALERRILRDGAQVLAHGALVCPSCGLPMAAHDQLPAGGEVRCGFCDHAAKAREFIAVDVFDTLANEVYLVARIV